MAKLRYGIYQPTGKLMRISDILDLPDPEEMRGEKCRCICPNPDCGKPLQARLGSGKENGGNEPHFSHGKNAECDLGRATQTVLHIMAKEVIAEEQRFFAPPISVRAKDIELNGAPAEFLLQAPVFTYPKDSRGSMIECQATLEQPEPGFVPDVVATTPKWKYFIEILVTHPVPPEKKAKVEKHRQPMLEINLSDYKDEEISREQLRRVLLNPGRRARWVFHPYEELAKLSALPYFRDEYEKWKQQEEKKKQREEVAKEKKAARIAQWEKEMKAKEPENNEKWRRIWQSARKNKRRHTW